MDTKFKNIFVIITICIICYFIYYYILHNIENFTTDEMKKYPQMLIEQCIKSKKQLAKLKLMNKRCNIIGQTNKETLNNRTNCYNDIGKEITTNLDVESNCVMANLINNRSKQINSHNNMILYDVNSKSTKSDDFVKSSKSNKSLQNLSTSNTDLNKKIIPIVKPIKITSSESVKPIKLSKFVKPIKITSKSVESSKSKPVKFVKSSEFIKSMPLSTKLYKSRFTSSEKTSKNQLLYPQEGPEFINKFYIPTYETPKASTYASITSKPMTLDNQDYLTSNKYSAQSSYNNINLNSDPGFLYRLSTYEKEKSAHQN